MHVYLREEKVRLRMEPVDGQGIVPSDSDLVPMAFFADDNAKPSFRALLPPDTVAVLRDALGAPVSLGVLAEEPENQGEEIRAMVGLAVALDQEQLLAMEQEDGEEDEPWKASAGVSEAWRGDDAASPEGDPPRTALLAFAPLVRLRRKYPALVPVPHASRLAAASH